jgi:hypothetical protein
MKGAIMIACFLRKFDFCHFFAVFLVGSNLFLPATCPAEDSPAQPPKSEKDREVKIGNPGLGSEMILSRERIDQLFTRSPLNSAPGMDKTKARKLLYHVMRYARLNPQDKNTYTTVKFLSNFYVKDLAKDWYALELWGYGGHIYTNLIVSDDGKVMPATPENCLHVCRKEFLMQVWDLKAVKSLCSKVLEGSNHGVIVSQNKDIPGYEKNRLPEDKSRILAPIVSHRLENQTVYKFYSYKRLGGVVWQCKLIIENKSTLTLSWEMEEVARNIGDADYIR